MAIQTIRPGTAVTPGVTLAFLALLVAGPAVVAAQQGPPDPGAAQPDAFPFSVERIKRQLAAQPPSDAPGLRLDFYIEVYGRAVTLDWLGDFEALKTGPVPYGAPTHREFVEFWTPQEFRAPAMDLSAGLRALMVWLNGRARKGQPDP